MAGIGAVLGDITFRGTKEEQQMERIENKLNVVVGFAIFFSVLYVIAVVVKLVAFSRGGAESGASE
jgi:hypothetical protein